MEGYEIDVQSDIHRRNLLKDARFYNLRHLTESLITCRTQINPFRGNARELLLSLTDFRASNCRIGWVENANYGWMEYKRAHEVDTDFSDLIVQIDDDGFVVGGGKIVLINRSGLKGMKTLKEAAEGRKTEIMSGPVGSELVVRIEIPGECYCVINGEERSSESLFEYEGEASSAQTTATANGETPSVKKRKFDETEEVGQETTSMTQNTSKVPSAPKAYSLKRSMWRVKVKGQSVPPSTTTTNTPQQQVAAGRRGLILVAVKLEGWTRERDFVKELSWL